MANTNNAVSQAEERTEALKGFVFILVPLTFFAGIIYAVIHLVS